jgi:argininosuccinate synthase
VDRIGQLTMRNLDIADSRAKLEEYAGLGLIGPAHSQLIGATPAGGADAIVARGEAPDDEAEALDRAAMEFGTD